MSRCSSPVEDVEEMTDCGCGLDFLDDVELEPVNLGLFEDVPEAMEDGDIEDMTEQDESPDELIAQLSYQASLIVEHYQGINEFVSFARETKRHFDFSEENPSARSFCIPPNPSAFGKAVRGLIVDADYLSGLLNQQGMAIEKLATCIRRMKKSPDSVSARIVEAS